MGRAPVAALSLWLMKNHQLWRRKETKCNDNEELNDKDDEEMKDKTLSRWNHCFGGGRSCFRLDTRGLSLSFVRTVLLLVLSLVLTRDVVSRCWDLRQAQQSYKQSYKSSHKNDWKVARPCTFAQLAISFPRPKSSTSSTVLSYYPVCTGQFLNLSAILSKTIFCYA